MSDDASNQDHGLNDAPEEALDAVAIVGMALRVPGARDLDSFWRNLRDGVEATTFFNDASLRAAGVPESSLRDPLYVKAFAVLEGAALFDAGFFDITPREAEVLDPQHRQLLECSWEALEHAGHAPGSVSFDAAGRIGLYSGVGLNSYLLHNLIGQRELVETLGAWQISLGNDKDFATTRVAYKLNLRGPAVNVNTACSTSLVAVAMGCQSLLSYQCDMILAGGCSVHLPQDQGYWHHPGGTLSPDGRCRAFDADAQGTLDGNGVAMVVLKRLDDARRDGDTIYALIRGYAVNNDGALKVGYTAPGVEGQAAVIREAQEMAGVDAASIGYVETHGTGTDLGDLVEVAALSEAFRGGGVVNHQQCAIGSVKTNIGHLDTAAGTASLIKTVLGLRHGEIPPSLHFRKPNPKLDLERSPFHVNAHLSAWPALQGGPRRAGVSSFGIGGTNAHVVVEEAPADIPGDKGRKWQVLPLSARSQKALEEGAQRLAGHLRQNPGQLLADVAYTLQTGRKAFSCRRAAVTAAAERAADALTAGAGPLFTGTRGDQAPAVVFMFPGQDAQFPGMAEVLYRDEPLFRAQVDRCAVIVREKFGIDLASRLFSPGGKADPAFATDALPLFVLEYSLAQVWHALGVRPQAMLGYSLGEYVCACMAGVMTLEEALALEVAGSALLTKIIPGALLAVSLGEMELRPLLGPEVEIAMVMAPRQCIVGGSAEAVADLQQRLQAQGTVCMLSQLDLPFHTSHMDPFVEHYRAEVRKVRLLPPRIPYVSCVTGDWITAEMATDPEYYMRLGRDPVHLTRGLQRLFELPEGLLLEVGPGQTISGLALLQPGRTAQQQVLSSLCDPRYQGRDAVESAFPTALARLWAAGVDVGWSALYSEERRLRLGLPSYAFDHRSYWIGARSATDAAKTAEAIAFVGKQPQPERWFHVPVWRELPPLPGLSAQPDSAEWLLVGGKARGIADLLAERLQAAGARVRQSEMASGEITDPAAWDALLAGLIAGGRRPGHIVYLGLLDCCDADDAMLLDQGFHALIAMGQAVGRNWFAESLSITLVAERLFALGDTVPEPAIAAVLGPLRVLPQEYANLSCRAVDLDWPASTWLRERQIDRLACELGCGGETALALRQGRRWCERYLPHSLRDAAPDDVVLRQGGVYLITGGLGNIGLTLARRIAERAPGARLLLTGRKGLAQAPADAEPTAQARVRLVRQITELGAEIRVVAADVTDHVAMAALIAAAERDWGALNGVIHAAGIVGRDSFATIADSTPAFALTQIDPKLRGARVLEEVLGGRPLDFCMMCSSLSPILGGLGFAAYAAGNAALDAFVAAHNLCHPTRWLGVNWEGWRFADEQADTHSAGAAVAELGLNPDEGAQAFERILASPGLERIVLSTADLQQRIRQWVNLDTPVVHSGSTAVRHERPAMLGAYVAPRGDIEVVLAGFWEQLLGIDGIGAEDSFFELGGNSLLLTQVLAQIRKHFGLGLSLARLFERPTITAIAELIAAEGADEDREEGEI